VSDPLFVFSLLWQSGCVNSPEAELNGTTTAMRARRHSRVRPGERARILEKLKRSALTLADFEARRSINYSTLVGWRQAQRRDAGLVPGASLLPGEEADGSVNTKKGLRFTEVCLRDEPETLELARREARAVQSPVLAPLEVTLRC
jgi:hypothetical protein